MHKTPYGQLSTWVCCDAGSWGLRRCCHGRPASSLALPFAFFSLPLPSHLLVIPILCPTKSQSLSQACAAVQALSRGVQVSREGISLCSAHRETSLPELLNPLENLCFLFTKLFTWSRFCSVDCSPKTSWLPRCRNGQRLQHRPWKWFSFAYPPTTEGLTLSVSYLLGCPSDNPSMPCTVVVGCACVPFFCFFSVGQRSTYTQPFTWGGCNCISRAWESSLCLYHKDVGSRGLVGARAPAQVFTLPTSRTPKGICLSITVIVLVFLGHNGCFQACLGPFGLGYGCCKAWYCLSRDGFTGDKDAVVLVLAGLRAVPPYPSRQSTEHILPISSLYLSVFLLISDGKACLLFHNPEKTLLLLILCFGAWSSHFSVIFSLSLYSHFSLELGHPLCTPVSTSNL